MKPSISVIITFYNCEKYIRKCLESILNQTVKETEIICIDDASSDHTLDILKEYEKKDLRISVIAFKKNRGVNYARNYALKLIKGTYVIILDGDDYFSPLFLEKLYKQAKSEDTDITFCGFYFYDELNEKIENTDRDINRSLLPYKKVFSMTPKRFDIIPSFVWNQMYKSDFIHKNSLHFACVQSFTDVYFNKTALLRAKRISFVDERLIYYRVNNKFSISHNLSALDAIKTIYHLYYFLEGEGLFIKYKKAFFETSLLKMNRSMNLPEPYRGILRSFYQKRLIPKFWGNTKIPSRYPKLLIENTCSDRFKKYFFYKREKIIPIILIANKMNFPLSFVTIQSIIENSNKDYFYDIYLFYCGNTLKINKLLSRYSLFNVRITCLKKIKNNFKEVFSEIDQSIKGYKIFFYINNNILINTDMTELLKIPQKKNLSLFKDNKDLCTDFMLFRTTIFQNKNTIDLFNKNKIYYYPKNLCKFVRNGNNSDIKRIPPILNYKYSPWRSPKCPYSKYWMNVAKRSKFYERFVFNCVLKFFIDKLKKRV